MQLNEYQDKAKETAEYPSDNRKGLDYCLLGLSGEIGELAQLRKRELRGDFSISDLRNNYDKYISEIGDVLWYLSLLCHELDVTLENVAQYNLDKLADRKERGVIKGSGDDR